MRCFVGDEFGSVDLYQLTDLPTPRPGSDEVRIRIAATALGFVDGLLVEGRYQLRPALPYVPGGEIAGVVDAVGSDVAGVSVGDRVAVWRLGGGLAEYIVVKANEVSIVPDELDLEIAAVMLLDFQTAHYALVARANLKKGETVLVLGAASGVGAAAVQLAAGSGANVIAAASTEAKRSLARRLGATTTVDSRGDLRSQMRDLVPSGVDVVVDPVGGTSSEAAFRSLAKYGRHLVIGFASGRIPSIPANLPLLKSGSLVGVDVRHFYTSDLDQARFALEALFGMMVTGILNPPSIQRFALHQSQLAIARTSDRDKAGKVVVVP
ncbi:alcohol dehydrogenase [Tardibacter chloracetimidivorans]|uniref:Alcohol dehydrogenase n=1 Tax=Tardibacter chloracetimidivorans TaxID=1921510 RepID=A0A1L3ZSP9_9SPHN|nr:alcohol dehydrogenase [Tardibacter chloracetimidivorans]